MKRTLLPFARLPSAFSLIEVTLAIGIVALAVVPLLGLLAVSFETDTGSEARFVSAGIVRDIVAELQHSTDATGPLVAVGRREDGSMRFWNGGEAQSGQTLDGTELYVGYDALGTPVRQATAGEFENGRAQSGEGFDFIARIVFEEALPPSGELDSPRFLRAMVKVNSPGAQETYATLLNATNQFESPAQTDENDT